MSDITTIFGDFSVAAWQVEGGVWSRTSGIARELMSSVKRNLMPGLAAMAMGAMTFGTPADVWASNLQLQSATFESASFNESVSESVPPNVKNSEFKQASDNWAGSEIARLRTDLDQLFAQYKAGDYSGFSAELMSFADQSANVMIAEDKARAISVTHVISQQSLLAEIHKPPQAQKALGIALRVLAT